MLQNGRTEADETKNYAMLDLMPTGRDETTGMDWVCRHDLYERKPPQ